MPTPCRHIGNYAVLTQEFAGRNAIPATREMNARWPARARSRHKAAGALSCGMRLALGIRAPMVCFMRSRRASAVPANETVWHLRHLGRRLVQLQCVRRTHCSCSKLSELTPPMCAASPAVRYSSSASAAARAPKGLWAPFCATQIGQHVHVHLSYAASSGAQAPPPAPCSCVLYTLLPLTLMTLIRYYTSHLFS